jgi:hypothetical protein
MALLGLILVTPFERGHRAKRRIALMIDNAAYQQGACLVRKAVTF